LINGWPTGLNTAQATHNFTQSMTNRDQTFCRTNGTAAPNDWPSLVSQTGSGGVSDSDNLVPFGAGVHRRPTDETYGGESDAQTVARLADLPLLDFGRVRVEEAKRLKVSVAILDKVVGRARCSDSGDNDSSAPLFPDTEPWPEGVDGAALLGSLSVSFERHVVLPPGAADALALWCLHAHTHSTATISPILAITSPTPECGKTTLLTLLGALVPKPLSASNITAAALFRAVEKWSPTMLVDEADTFLRSSDELRGILNSGHNRAGAFVIRTQGDDHEPKKFRTWSPKAVALIGKLPPTLASRGLHIELRRKAIGEKAEPVRADRLGHLVPLNRQAIRFAADNELRLSQKDPELPPTLTGRRADNWRHLFAIAEIAGGEWPERARLAAQCLSSLDEGQTAAVDLLEDIRRLFSEEATDRQLSGEIVKRLAAMEDRPWPEWRNGQPITAVQMARLLKPFGISPKTIRTTTGRAKGYHRDDFCDVFDRYLPAERASVTTPERLPKTPIFNP
jgi:hypothetical protein